MSRLSLRRWMSLIGLAALLFTPAAPATAQSATPSPTRTTVRFVTATPTATPSATRVVWPSFTPGPSPTPTLTSGPNNYVVQYGDTLLKIARRYGITSPALRTVNSLSSDTIYAGQVLFIPSPIPTTTKTPLPAGYFTYVVQAGDQLRALAKQFGITLTALRTANNLTSDVIRTGQVLAVPPPQPTATPRPAGSTYIVQAGDQLLVIARRFGLTLSSLRAANNLTTDVIRAGQALFIPTVTPTRTPAPPSATPTGVYTAYVVQPGDRLQRIAVWYGVTMTALRTANNLPNDTLRAGQTLTIPNPNRRPLAYTVQPGDNLTNLAARFETTIADLRLANGMGAGDTILAGLIMIIPAKP